MAWASSGDMPSTVQRSCTLASATPRTPPKRCSNLARFFGPTPGMSSKLLPPVRTLARLARIPVMAKRCASSRICATNIKAAESACKLSLGRSSANTNSSKPTLRPSPFSTPTKRDRSKSRAVNTSVAMLIWPLPPSISTKSGKRASPERTASANLL